MRRRSTPQAWALRCRIILACAEGASNKDVAARLGSTPHAVGRWRARFVEHRITGLGDMPRSGGPRTVTDEQVAALVTRTLESAPKNATHWSTRSMARQMGLSQSTVSRVWRAFGLQPHRSETFKLSTDPYFVDKVHDVVGLYLDPPERALVFCVDEKSQIQALDRSQPVLPMMPGVPQRVTHDYVRAGTTTLFAALEVATGKVIGSLHRRHRAEEFKKFLIKLDREVPGGLDIHLVLNNYATHKTPAVKTWLLGSVRRITDRAPASDAGWLSSHREQSGVRADVGWRRSRGRGAFGHQCPRGSRPVPNDVLRLPIVAQQRHHVQSDRSRLRPRRGRDPCCCRTLNRRRCNDTRTAPRRSAVKV
ncbi:transcriptional regulator, RpiR family [Streptomyces sp. BpilaLS-43]|nr:transcriptional regulator, RpiR family [Streptomyces sp. BpilaLS-43]